MADAKVAAATREMDAPKAPDRVSGDGAESLKSRATKSSNSISILVIISRITGFLRTSAQAWALGAAGLASAYTVANGLPNLLYEFVVGGMLITAFLPVYVHAKRRLGNEGASEYASNLLSIVLVLMAVLAVLCFVLAEPIIWTQSAGATSGFNSDLSVWFFRFFTCEIVLYALSSIFSGVLNAERDFFWSSFAPIFNNIITIGSFALYGFIVHSGMMAWNEAVIVLAIGHPLAVATQVFMQVPALRRHGVRLRLKVNLHDPALRETVKIGLPTFLASFAAVPTTAVTSSCALAVTAAGASIAYYSRTWYVLPYSIFAIPISTTLYTELSNSFLADDLDAFKDYFNDGVKKILFTLIPCMMFLIVFAPALISVFAAGEFTAEDTALTADYLKVLALALPFYGLSSHLQKSCSAMMNMTFYAVAVCVGSAVQIIVCIVFTPIYGLYVVPITTALFYLTLDVMVLVKIRAQVGSYGIRSIALSVFRACAFGLAGSAVASIILSMLSWAFGPCQGMLSGLAYSVAAGIPALVVTFGTASYLGVSDAPFFDALFSRIFRRGRHRS